MTKFVLTFLVGVVAGAVGIQLQEQRVEREEQHLAAEASHTRTGTRTLGAVTAARAAPTLAATRGDARASSRPSPSRVHPPVAPSAQVESRQENAAQSSVSGNANEREVPVTEAHQPLLSSTYDGRTLGELHETLEREAEDVSWSYEKEQQLSEFFIPAHGLPFDVRSIECRTTMCEIQAFALGPTQQNTVLEDLHGEPWYDFSSAFTELGDHAGTTSVLMYLLRRR